MSTFRSIFAIGLIMVMTLTGCMSAEQKTATAAAQTKAAATPTPPPTPTPQPTTTPPPTFTPTYTPTDTPTPIPTDTPTPIPTREMRSEPKLIPALTASFQELTQLTYLRALAVSPDGQFLAFATNDIIRLWDLQKNVALQDRLLSSTVGTRDLAFTPDSQMLVSGGLDQKVYVWKVPNIEKIFELDGHQEEIKVVAVSPDGSMAATGDWKGVIILWDLIGGQEISRPVTSGDHSIEDLDFSPDGKLLAFTAFYNGVQLWDIAQRKPAGSLNLLSHVYGVVYIAFSPDSNMLAGSTNGLIVWDIKKLSPLGMTQDIVGGYQEGVVGYTEIGFSPDGRWIVTSGKGSEIVLFDAVTRDEVGRLANPGFNSDWVVPYFLPDGRILANYVAYNVADNNELGRIVVWTLGGQ